jgi:hypothetical protein
MDIHRLRQIGDRLQELEQQRGEVIHQLTGEVQEKHDVNAKRLYGRLSEISHSAQELITEQRELAEKAVGNLHLPGQPGHYATDTTRPT